MFTFAAFLLYTLQVAMAFALMSALYGDFMQVWSNLIYLKEPDLIDQIINLTRNHSIDKLHVHFAHTSKYLLNWWDLCIASFYHFFQTAKKEIFVGKLNYFHKFHWCLFSTKYKSKQKLFIYYSCLVMLFLRISLK